MQKQIVWGLWAIALAFAAIFSVVTMMGVANSSPLGKPSAPVVDRRLFQRGAVTITAFGSSSTEGVGATSSAGSYPNRMQAELRTALPDVTVTVLNRGIGGEDADDMMKRLPRIIAEHPDLIVWQTGSNDAIKLVPVDHFIAETRSGIEAMRRARIDVVLMEPQDCAVLRAIPGSMRYVEAVRALGVEMGVPNIRRFDLMQEWVAQGKVTEADLMSADALHMADSGYALLAQAATQTILAYGGRVPAVASVAGP